MHRNRIDNLQFCSELRRKPETRTAHILILLDKRRNKNELIRNKSNRNRRKQFFNLTARSEGINSECAFATKTKEIRRCLEIELDL